MNFYGVFVRAPVNKQAAAMFTGGAEQDDALSKDEINYLINRLIRKRSLLNMSIWLGNLRQRRNLCYKLNKGRTPQKALNNHRAVEEFKRNGEALAILQKELARRNKAQALVNSARRQWSDEERRIFKEAGCKPADFQ